jgi:hypothetical protein
MWLKILLIVLILVAVLALIWWNNNVSGNIAYFDGTSTFQIPSSLFTKGKLDELMFALKSGAPNGIVLFMRAGDKFMIAYVQDGKLIVNNSNDQNTSGIMDSLNQEWNMFAFAIDDAFKDVPIYFGGALADQIPVNTLVFEGQSDVIPFPTSNLKACTNDCFLNNVNLSAMFRKQGYRTYC